MLSYPIDEAEELLATKLSAAKQNLANCEEDLDFLREQITVCSPSFVVWELKKVYFTNWEKTMEVATARVYNWDVTMKRKEKIEHEALEGNATNGSPNG